MAQTFLIDGLHCQGCADTITEVLGGLPVVTAVRVALDTKAASTIELDAASEISVDEVRRALDAKGNFSVLSN